MIEVGDPRATFLHRAGIGDPHRFTHPARLAAYAGVPGQTEAHDRRCPYRRERDSRIAPAAMVIPLSGRAGHGHTLPAPVPVCFPEQRTHVRVCVMNLKWWFPESGGRGEGFNQGGMSQFTDDHLYRELVQNSLDALDAHRGSGAVLVELAEVDLDTSRIDGTGLAETIGRAPSRSM